MKSWKRLAIFVTCAALIGVGVAGCGGSTDETTAKPPEVTTTPSGKPFKSNAAKPEDGKTGGTPNAHVDKAGDAAKSAD